MLPAGGKPRAIRQPAPHEFNRRNPSKDAKVAGEVRLVVVAAVIRDVNQMNLGVSFQLLNRPAKSYDAREHLRSEAHLFCELRNQMFSAPAYFSYETSYPYAAAPCDHPFPHPQHSGPIPLSPQNS